MGRLPGRGEASDGRRRVDASGEHTIEARNKWLAERERLTGKMGRPSFVSATSLGRHSGEDKEEPDSPEPWRRGRAGTSVGRAVHAMLQAIDLATGEGIQDRARAQAAAEGIPEREEEIARLCRDAVESAVVRRAVGVRQVLAGGAGGGSGG